MKMYICVKQSLASHKCIGIAHGVLMAHLKFAGLVDYQNWLNNSFKKVIVEVTDEEFEKLKLIENSVIVTENTLNNAELCQVFCPRSVWPEEFKKFPLLKI